FYESGAIFVYNFDKEGSPVLFIRLKFHFKMPEVTDFEVLFLMHLVSKVDKLAASKQITFVVDFAGAGIRNCDISFIKSMLDILVARFPKCIKNVLILDMPFLFQPVWKAFRLILDEDTRNRIKLINRKQLAAD